MSDPQTSTVFDFVVIGSGFGGSVSAMRLAQKGYSVLIIEQGKRFRDEDFAKTNWQVGKYIWLPSLRCFGILQISPFKDMFVMHGVGVGGGSLGYSNVLMKPSEILFDDPSWRDFADWKSVLEPHYQTAERMLGVKDNPCLWASDHILLEIAHELGTEASFHPTKVGVFFDSDGKDGQEYPDPYFDGQGPSRNSCTHCGACMIGCRTNAKNTLEKNYLFFAETWGAQILAERVVTDIRPIKDHSPDSARYEVFHRSSTSWLPHPHERIRTRNIVFAAGTLGTLKLLFHCRDVSKTLPRVSRRLGSMVRTNNESLMGAVVKDQKIDYSKGISITSFVHADPVTAVEPVRYPAGSSLMRFLSAPLIEGGNNFFSRLGLTLLKIITHPVDFLRTHVLPGWAENTTILLVMQTGDNRLHMKFKPGLFKFWQKRLVSEMDEGYNIASGIEISHKVTKKFAEKSNGIPAGTINEALLNIPMTAHILGGVPLGSDDNEGVIDLDCQIFNYPGLYVVDGSIMPANPGVNPSLTITALAEYAMSRIQVKEGYSIRTLHFSNN